MELKASDLVYSYLAARRRGEIPKEFKDFINAILDLVGETCENVGWVEGFAKEPLVICTSKSIELALRQTKPLTAARNAYTDLLAEWNRVMSSGKDHSSIREPLITIALVLDIVTRGMDVERITADELYKLIVKKEEETNED